MNDFTTEILKTLANKGDLNELFRVHLEKITHYTLQGKVWVLRGVCRRLFRLF